jgi:hypothetical protein
VTATRDRRSDPDDDAEPAWDERSIFGKSRGLPWWSAVLLAFVLAAIGASVDMQRQDTLGTIYQGAYLLGCLVAICLVRRGSLFGPMVQPPLVFAVTAMAAIVLLGPDTGGSGGLKSLIFSVALPLTSNFPTMAITTVITVGIGGFRLWRERDPDAPARPARPGRAARDDDDAFRDDAAFGEAREARPRGGRERPSKNRTPPSRPRRGEAGRVDEPEGRRGTRGRGEGRGEGLRDRDEPDAGGRGRPDRGGRARPDADPEDPQEGRGSRRRPGRDPRPDRREPAAGRDRDTGASRTRARDAEPPPRRRRDPAADPRPRGEDRPAPSRRDPGDRPTPSRQRRRPEDPYR